MGAYELCGFSAEDWEKLPLKEQLQELLVALWLEQKAAKQLVEETKFRV